jgi:hypothetical protein
MVKGILIAITYIKFLTSCTHEYHVSEKGSDQNPGSAQRPFRTISAAAQVAEPGDVITVHAGTYRERINPPRGGLSDEKRITYQAAPGERVEIRGSERIMKWKALGNGVWTVTLPDTFFGSYNPYKDLIHGDWFDPMGRKHHKGEVYLNGWSLYEADTLSVVLNGEMAVKPAMLTPATDTIAATYTWYCTPEQDGIILYANFHEFDPNLETVEINVRGSCFYPDKPGINYITVRGFTMSQAATQWAAPTAEQPGLIGTHWSKGWIIENNHISDSRCVGITLGKDRASGHNVWSENPSKDGAIHYIEVVKKAIALGWNKENIGSHIVRNNTIFNCGVAGICGSLGAVFSEISGNHIYNIWTKRLFAGPEKGGIKIHAAIDVIIKGNRIHNAHEGIWLDWMAQGTRVSSNLCYGNDKQDFFAEVNHGPYLVDNNIFLSGVAIWDWSCGGAYLHNLIAGKVYFSPQGRETPYFRPHSTEIAGIRNIRGGDTRYLNNVFVIQKNPSYVFVYPSGWGGWIDHGLNVYDTVMLPVMTGGNIYLHGAKTRVGETDCLVQPGFDPEINLVEKGGQVYLTMTCGDFSGNYRNQLITTELLGRVITPDCVYNNPDGTPLKIDTDYFGHKRNETYPSAGPFEVPGEGQISLKVW